MIRLNLQREPYWLDIFADVRFRVRPLTTAVLSAARARATQAIAELREQAEQAREAGMASEDQAALLDDDDLRRGRAELIFAKSLARYAIVEWEGIGNETGDAPAPVTPENVAKSMEIPQVWERFVDRYQRSLDEALAEGNASGPAPSGTSAAGPNTATDAAPKDSPAPTAGAA